MNRGLRLIARGAVTILPAGVLGACATASVHTARNWGSLSRAERIRTLDQITARCALSDKFFRLSDEAIQINSFSPVNTKSKDCAFTELFKLPGVTLDLIGNAYVSPEDRK